MAVPSNTQTSSSSLGVALRLNNEAVSLLVAGQEQRALERLQQAVVLVKRVVARHIRNHPAVVAVSSSKTGIEMMQGATSSSSSSIVTSLEQLEQRAEESSCAVASTANIVRDCSVTLSGFSADLECYVYNRAFRLSCEHLPCEMEAAAQLASSIVIFNMALVLHRICLKRVKTVPAEKPLSLYKIILTLLKSSPSKGLAGAIRLATLNNMSQLQLDEGQYQTSQQGFERLANLMATIQPYPPLLPPSEMRGIVMNILCLKRGAKFAPAA
mmetsp:Transcript_20670/g.36334  ORF Transcript_20670/g.36334 Transcript_20670/m.36334 type:complete len:270 (+) Transcript_20670:207-1016(+)|eukprot:CAMPEP_0178771984 /NCGR_PEP_ID=MMETSP0744-20121128/22283_1 /TAXON_ID=913974 /ORGANISM="Nitzschia punctata, Strain CCMP561" /LENGTH=269 /DNA_ID=CAMNT_0020428597 /DNA_START=83 /DNA_END=892 /DNA_ORIENTATION=+